MHSRQPKESGHGDSTRCGLAERTAAAQRAAELRKKLVRNASKFASELDARGIF